MSNIVNKIVDVRPSTADNTLPGLFALRDIEPYKKQDMYKGKLCYQNLAVHHICLVYKMTVFANRKNCPFNGLDLASVALD